jgi:TPR repeat protein
MNRKTLRLLLLLLLCVAPFLVWHDRMAFELGYAWSRGDFHGWKLDRDDARAVYWWRHAAATGHPRAQYLLGLNTSRGWGVAANDAEAEYWFNRAAAQNYPPACFHLAWMLHKGEGVARDEARAQGLMTRAAELGMSAAALALGRFHERGEGVAVNPALALHWYARAVESSRRYPDRYDNPRYAEVARVARNLLLRPPR